MRSAALRAGTALALVVAIVVVPLVLDQCAAACELARAGLLASPAPSCHHAPSSAASIGHAPQRCGHDHNMARMTASDTSPLPRALVSRVASASVSTTADAAPPTPVHARAPDLPPDLGLHASSPLRI